MTIETGFVLLLLVLAIVFFAMEIVSVDIVTLVLLMALVGSRMLTVEQAFAGFSNDIIIILGSIFVLNGALQETGVLDAVGAWFIRFSGGSVNRLTFAVMMTTGAVSAFMNNTTVTALFLAPILGAARSMKVSPSKLLMPLSFASILGGTCTLIGTSTNVAVSGFIARRGMEPLGLFELTPIGVIILGTGIAYMMLAGRRFLPDHPDESLTEEFHIREYLTEIIVMPGSHLIGQKVFESDLARMDFRILTVIRGQQRYVPDSRLTIAAGDILLVAGQVKDLMKVKETSGIEIRAEVKLGDQELEGEDVKIAEALITPRSGLVRRTLKDSNFRQRFGLTVLAISRHGQTLHEKLGRIRLRVGDLLLVQGTSERLSYLQRNPDLAVLSEYRPPVYRRRKGLYVVGFFVGAVVLSWLGWMPLSICFLAAAVMTVLTRCITSQRAYEFIDWRLLVLIGGMTAFGTAMDRTGTAGLLAGWIVAVLEPFGAMAIVGGFFVLTVLLTQPMSNAAAALVMLPVALEAAQKLGVNERTFAVAIMLAASLSFIAPFEPSCVLVYGPGKYRFRDFVKTGGGLTAILMVLILILIPLFWPLKTPVANTAKDPVLIPQRGGGSPKPAR